MLVLVTYLKYRKCFTYAQSTKKTRRTPFIKSLLFLVSPWFLLEKISVKKCVSDR